MAVSNTLRRLLRIRLLEEHQSRAELESVLGELHRLERRLSNVRQLDLIGRRLVDASAASGEVIDRLAGIEESRAARYTAACLVPRIADAEEVAAEARQSFLDYRVARRQVETLIEEAEARDALVAGRRSQQTLDDWYGLRRYRDKEE